MRRLARRKAILGAFFVLLIVALLLSAYAADFTPARLTGSRDVTPDNLGSSAIDAGADLRPAGVMVDMMGTPRPQGDAFDIGAYEYTPGTGSPSPGALAVPSAAPPSPTGRVYYLAPDGDDGGPGTPERPWRTLHHAAQQIGQPGGPQPGDTVYLRGGRYPEVGAIFSRGGQPGAPLTVAAYPGERPVLDGAQDISGGWERVAGTVYRRSFTRNGGLTSPSGRVDPATVSTTPDGYQAAGDRSAFLYIDDQPDTDHWLRPYSPEVAGDGLGGSWANLPPRGFGTTAPPPPQPAGFYAGRADTVYVNLGHLPDADPNRHRIRIPAHEHAILQWGENPGHLIFRGLTFELHSTAQYAWASGDGVVFEDNTFRLIKQRVLASHRCTAGWRFSRNTFQHYSYEAIHVESDASLVEGNLLERTLIGYAPWGPGGINVVGSGNTVRGNVARHLKRQTSGNYSGEGGTPYAQESWELCGRKSAQGNRFEGNVAHDIEGSMFMLIGGDGAAVVNNLGYGLAGSGVAVLPGGTGGGLGEADRLATGHLIANNTFSGLGRPAIDLNNEARGVVIANNILDGAGGPYYFHPHATYERRANLDDGRDPRFADPANADFRLRGASAARGVGMTQEGSTRDREVAEYAAGPALGVARRARWRNAPPPRQSLRAGSGGGSR